MFDDYDEMLLNQAVNAWLFSNNGYDLELCKQMLLNRVEYIQHYIDMKENDREAFIERKKKHFGKQWREEYLNYV